MTARLAANNLLSALDLDDRAAIAPLLSKRDLIAGASLYFAFRRRSALEKRMIAIQLTFLMALILVSSVILVILGNTILDFIFHYLRTGAFTRWLLFAFRWIVIFFLFYAGISSIYRYGSSTKRKIP